MLRMAFTISEETLEAIDKFKEQHDLSSRSDALRKMIDLAAEKEKEVKEEAEIEEEEELFKLLELPKQIGLKEFYRELVKLHIAGLVNRSGEYLVPRISKELGITTETGRTRLKSLESYGFIFTRGMSIYPRLYCKKEDRERVLELVERLRENVYNRFLGRDGIVSLEV